MKSIKVITKLMVRLFFILLLATGVLVMQSGDRLKQLGYIELWQWRMIFPVLLIGGFIGLLVASAYKKYENNDLNLLLIVNTVMLIIYGMAIFFRLSAPLHT